MDTGDSIFILTGRPKGRGSNTNPAGRFERHSTAPVDDGWNSPDDLPPLRTETAFENPRSVISKNKSPDLPFDRSLNPYRGCEHGCVYCFARPTHAYLGLSPGLDFETRLTAKPDAARVLERELSRPSYSPAPLAMGTNTDPYQPIEKELQITRSVLEVLQRWQHPVSIVTKGTLIERDVDILAEMATKSLASVGISITTLDRDLSRSMEPRAPGPARRLSVISALAARGIPVRVMVAPIVPGLTDHELEAILREARNAGASRATYIALRLPGEVSGLFRDWLARERPGYAARVMARVGAFRDGADYQSEFGTRMTGTGEHADLLAKRFRLALRTHGFEQSGEQLRCDLFKRPKKESDQMELF